jgi:hypothetical protein
MAQRIVIDGAVLTQEIATLSGVRAQTVANTASELTSKGHTARVAGDLATLFTSVDEALNVLIDQTSAFLVNVQDGFADVDAAATAAATRLDNEVSQ